MLLGVSLSSQRQSKTHLIRYPDGQDRLLTMSEWHWNAVEKMRDIDIDLADILELAIKLANECPTDLGFDADVISCTIELVQTMDATRRNECNEHANDWNEKIDLNNRENT